VRTLPPAPQVMLPPAEPRTAERGGRRGPGQGGRGAGPRGGGRPSGGRRPGPARPAGV
jgi:hypothetical protein